MVESEIARRRASGRPRRSLRDWLLHFVEGMRDAIAIKPVRLGLLGSVLLAIGSLTPAYLPQASPYWPYMRALGLDTWGAKAAGTGLVIAAVAALMIAWFRMRSYVYTETKHWAVLLWWSLPLLLAPPIFSHDAYSYAAQGWLIHNGFNPYESGPGFLPGPFADQVAWVWRYTTAPYGPLALQMSHWLVLLAGLNPYYSAVAMRIPALAGVAMIGFFLPRIAHYIKVDPRDVAWFSIINPLVVIDFVGGAHNDALMMGLVIWALYWAYRGHFWGALIMVGTAMAIKQPALLATVPIAVIGSGWQGLRVKGTFNIPGTLKFTGRLLLSFAVVIGTFSAISVATGLGFGWISAVSVPGSIVTLAPTSLLGWLIQTLLDLAALDPTGRMAFNVTQTAGLVVVVIFVTWLFLRLGHRRPLTFLSWSYLAFAILGPALHPWYLTWGGLLLPLARPSVRVMRWAAAVTTVLLIYGAGNLAWRNDAVALALAAIAAGLLIFYRPQIRAATEALLAKASTKTSNGEDQNS